MTCSSPDLVVVGPPPVATRLAFVVQPTNAVRDTAFATAIQVQVLDQNGALLTTATNPITLSLGLNPNHATLSGFTTISAVAGIAAFPGLKLDSLGTGYTLIASADPLIKDTSAAFNVTLSLADVDGDGFSPNAGDCNDTRADVHPGATDYPDSTFTDANCDGLDGEKTNATFVQTTGADSAGCGPQTAPCLTIKTAIARAVASGKRDVYVSAGAYAGFTAADGINVFGLFDAAWARAPGNTVTVTGHQQTVAGLPDSAAVTVIAVGLTKATTLADLTLVGAAATGTDSSGAGRNSYVVLAKNVTGPGLTLMHDHLIGGPGATGVLGAPGVDADTLTADSAMFGGSGAPAVQVSVSCDDTSFGAGGSAGTPQGASSGGSRAPGKGGHGGTMDTDCSCCSYDFTARPGTSGDTATQFDGAHGIGGSGGSGSINCGPAGDGKAGLYSNGFGGTAGVGNGAFDTAGVWHGVRGTDGQVGDNGGGGGGGGGSGGCDNGTDSWGGGGGGGGAGGAKAKQGGGGGGPGGASVAIYLIGATLNMIGGNITNGVGGTGGAGGVGGQGQSGGTGGAGGAKAANGSAPGKGGDGGHGGHGGGGGGGQGGMSYGLFAGTPSTVVVTGTTFTFDFGSAGVGGSGGQSAPNAPLLERDGNAGQVGNNGPVGGVGGYTAAARRY